MPDAVRPLKGKVLIQGTTHEHVEQLVSFADAQHGLFVLQGITARPHQSFVNFRLVYLDSGMRILPIVGRSHILPAGEQDSVADSHDFLCLLHNGRCR